VAIGGSAGSKGGEDGQDIKELEESIRMDLIMTVMVGMRNNSEEFY
jgi:hypothetical protein